MNVPNENIRYLCLSDMHAGALSSVLTPLDAGFGYDPDGSSATATTFGVAIGATLKTLVGDQAPPDLLLLGDALDMSFSPPDQSSEVLAGFLGGIFATDGVLSDRIVFLPGNHDHALWTAERFDGRAETGPIPGFRHVTPAFQQPQDCPKSRILGSGPINPAPSARDQFLPQGCSKYADVAGPHRNILSGLAVKNGRAHPSIIVGSGGKPFLRLHSNGT